MFEHHAPSGQLAGSRVAHAEINALVQLGVDSRYHDHVLYSMLEPCSECIGAAWFSTIGTVRFAASDAYGGASRLIDVQLEITDIARRYPMRIEGALEGPFALLAEVLHAEFFMRTRPQNPVTQSYQEGAQTSPRWLRS